MDKTTIIEEINRYAQENLVHTFDPGKTYIPPAAPQLEASDVKTLSEVLLQFWYTEYKYCRKFEKELERVTGKPHVSLVNSGSSASLVAITAAVRIFDPGHTKKYILTCATGFPTTVSPIIQNGYIPIYVDMNDDLTPNLFSIASAIDFYDSALVGAVFAHTLGFPFDEKKIRELLGPDRFLVSDCCDALGATTSNLPVGSFSDFSTLSFFPSHHIMAAEGGAVMSNTDEHASLVSSISNWGRSCFCRPGESNTCGKRFTWEDRGDLPEGWDHKYIFSEVGYNLKMTEFQGALGYSQIQRLDKFVDARKENYQYLYGELNRSEYHPHIHLIEPSSSFSPFGFPILVTSDVFTAGDLIAWLEGHKVGTRRLFAGNLVRQPGFMNQRYAIVGDLYGSDMLMNQMFWISVSPSLNRSMLNYMIYMIDQFFISRGLV
jgi:CDP-6-deoxy-D-xylo-4-hexulose-3-dehydrase